MRKIIISMVLAILSLMVGTFSFLVNDLAAYRQWMIDNGPQIMENFGHHDKQKNPPNDISRAPMHNEMQNRDNRSAGVQPAPPMNPSSPDNKPVRLPEEEK